MTSEGGYHIIGGGIVGASIAYHIGRRTNDPVHVYEKGTLANETTKKSLAFFGFYGDETQYRMKQYGMELYNDFLSSPRADPGYVTTGRLNVATSEEGAEALRQDVENRNKRLADADGKRVDTSPVDFAEPHELKRSLVLPFLDTNTVTGGIFRPQVGYLRPREMAIEFIERARDEGVVFHENTTVTDLTVDDGVLSGLSVDGEERTADEVISAAGPWNPRVAAMANVDLPVKHTLAPVLELEPAEPIQYTIPWITHRESGFSIRRNADGRVLMTHHPPGKHADATEYDPDAVEDSVPTDLRQRGLDVLESLLPVTDTFDVVDERVGIRSSTPDGNPVVGWTRVDGFSVAAFSTSGIQLAPATGKVIATQLLDNDPTSFYEGLSVSRFDSYVDHK
ncbi:FAD-dependent oxidoreductase [Halobellus sp. H-GB7]|uniref:NAD(P)/FAD-dependent oxidoreductase n=1 Tax=Halobellus sp. H-GB7 TaxID=3069756 RepID=UPI0027AFEFB0|nr:FAD-dependent oxidoreductase [Halobellus sp. H-GB7]MDQ2055918.1 FAD-dependent oxidoreductase [Halobellus sp. H-GB7]